MVARDLLSAFWNEDGQANGGAVPSPAILQSLWRDGHQTPQHRGWSWGPLRPWDLCPAVDPTPPRKGGHITFSCGEKEKRNVSPVP